MVAVGLQAGGEVGCLSPEASMAEASGNLHSPPETLPALAFGHSPFPGGREITSS